MADDYIRKQDAVEALYELRVNSLDAEKGLLLLSGIAAASDIIESLEPADVAPVRHARWRHYEGMYTCEACGAQLDDESPFCPMCGAKMDREE